MTEHEQLELSDDDGSVEFTELPSEDEVDAPNVETFREAVLHSTDWTTETIVSQLRRGNIVLNPSFQRRDAWKVQQKSRFIESLILGLPIPQIVLAEVKDQRGKFIVLDGKQRLLSILQYWGLGHGANNAYALAGLEIRKDLTRKNLTDLEADTSLENDLNALLNQPIRTVVIRNWPNVDFLHLVFLRLNTGSVKLSPQELRQALFPGPFSSWVDDVAVNSAGLRTLLKLKDPDYRMRDIEVLSRYFAFRFFLSDYRGRMKKFLDLAFERFNVGWDAWEPQLATALDDFEAGTSALIQVFGPSVGRKPGSRPFNRAVFDFLIFYAQRPHVRNAMLQHPGMVQTAFENLFRDPAFKSATERDTAGIPNTVKRLAAWGNALGDTLHLELPTPEIVDEGGDQRVSFTGF